MVIVTVQQLVDAWMGSLLIFNAYFDCSSFVFLHFISLFCSFLCENTIFELGTLKALTSIA